MISLSHVFHMLIRHIHVRRKIFWQVATSILISIQIYYGKHAFGSKNVLSEKLNSFVS